MPLFKDLSGKTFGRLKVDRRGSNLGRRVAWICTCSCGEYSLVAANKLINGHTQSCGCLQKEMSSFANKKHGQSSYPNKGKPTKEYNTWVLMRKRCSKRATDKDRRLYFDRGIVVCEKWENSFEDFIADMGPAPSINHSIDRVNGALGYSKENCRWADSKEQARNRTNTAFLIVNGRTKSIGEWSDETGINYKRIHARIKRGWTPEKAVTTPVK